MSPPAITSYSCKLSAAQGKELHHFLKENNYKFQTVEYTTFAAEGEKVQIRFYTSGKLLVQGRNTQDFVQFVLEPLILKEAKLGYEEILNPEMLLPRLGVDESGKGDFFGPMCVAGVYVNETVVRSWKDKGIRDSKDIGTDRKIAELAKVIQDTPGCVTAVVPIGNEAYNRLYAKMKSVNSILAWGHARVIENLMLKQYQMNPPPTRAISDQFSHTKETVARALMGQGKQIELIQRHKAEADLAVAAASILARHEFVSRLKRLGEQYGVELPKGASAAVEAAAKAFIEKHGAANLVKVAKTHFRTAYRVQGLPEPPKKEWDKTRFKKPGGPTPF